jgi:putative ABC transport system ATP-binding protein
MVTTLVQTDSARNAAASEPLIKLRDLTKSYEEAGTSHTILHAINADIPEGKFVILLGKSGSGKSTLLNLIGGIDVPTSGEIWIDDTNMTRLSERDLTIFRRDNIGFVFQFFNLIPTLTALENVSLPYELSRRDRRAGEKIARDLLARVGLAHRADTYPDRLSGGEQQRIAIARALVHQPTLILADEPTGNLDEETGKSVLELLLQLTRSAGKTMIMATHNAEVVPFADVVYYIHDGKLVSREQGGTL